MNATAHDIRAEPDVRPVVHKFGGSSVADAAAIGKSIEIVAGEAAARSYVVVSAAGGVTNNLLECLRLAATGGPWPALLARIRRRQLRLVERLLADEAGALCSELRRDCQRLAQLLDAAALLRVASTETSDAVTAHGELWSMRLITATLRRRGVDARALDARDFLRARRIDDRIEIDWRASGERFATTAGQLNAAVVVIPGFIASCAARGITLTLGRNGSDWSATIVARLARARAVTIWSDVAGILEADPAVVTDAATHPHVGIEAAAALAAHGARILHPTTLDPLAGLDIDVRVRCTFESDAAGTCIDERASQATVIAAHDHVVSAIGASAPPFAALAALEHARVPVCRFEIAPGRISAEVDAADVVRTQRVWHRHLCRHRRRVDVLLIGTGKVGGALLCALHERDAGDIRLLGVANSTAACLDATGIAARQAHRRLRATPVRSEPQTFGAFLLAQCEAAPVIVDATASAAISAWHPHWLAQGIHVVTANKLAAAAGLVTATHRAQAFYGDTATVGAGLPVLAAIRRLRAAGDTIESIEGILSGSLAHIFHALERGRPFSAALAAARRAGYSEPDPRADLAGTDVARKLAIIAAAAGIDAAIAKPRALLPLRLAAADAAGSDAGLSPLDAAFAAQARAARTRHAVLRYTASLCADGASDIGLREVPRDDPLAQTQGTDNIVVIRSRDYRRQPIVIRGPGAGPGITARSLLADIGTILEQFG